jgi:hypothetical protein
MSMPPDPHDDLRGHTGGDVPGPLGDAEQAAAPSTPAPRVPDALDEIRARMNAQSDARDLARDLAREQGRPTARADRAPATTPLPSSVPVTRTSPHSRAVRVSPVGGVPGVMPPAVPARRRGGRAGWYIGALLAVGLAATVRYALDLRTRLGTADVLVREKSALLARTEARLGERERTLGTLLTGRGNVVLVNFDAAAPTGPGMQLFWNVREGKAVVNAFGLAQVATDRVYMLWMIRDGAPVALERFTPDENGRALLAEVKVPTNSGGITLFVVTEESAQGADAPTMTPFLSGTVPPAR